MHKKFSLLVAITLATVLGGGCGQGESPVAGKSNKFSEDPEVKEKRAKAVELLIAKCTECGIAEGKARKYKPYFEEFLDSSAENIAQNFYKAFPTKEAARMRIKGHRALVVVALVDELKLKHQILSTHLSVFKINSRQDLMKVFISNGLEMGTYYEFALVLDDLGISDNDIPRIKEILSKDKFMSEFLYACADFLVARIEKG